MNRAVKEILAIYGFCHHSIIPRNFGFCQPSIIPRNFCENSAKEFEMFNCCLYRIGRKKALVISAVLQVSAAVSVAFVSNYYVFVVLNFLVGAACHGVFVPATVLSKKKHECVISTFLLEKSK